MKCVKCGTELRQEENHAGFSNEIELPPRHKVYTCMNANCEKYNYPQRIIEVLG